ncbi:MAG: orotidine-5'-phosphate decarboxylase [Porticoccaceae bacterium]
MAQCPRGSRIIVALDYPDADSALRFVGKVHPDLCRLKVGKELFTAAGPQLVQRLVASRFDVFLDLKFHDIPSTVAKAVAAAGNLGVWMTNVHAAGGGAMMAAAADSLRAAGQQLLLVAVTILTSMNQADLDEIGCERPLVEQALHLAALAQRSGLDGVVCSPWEAHAIHRRLGDDFLCITPGIRGGTGIAAGDDQTRVMTPLEAVRAGSDYLVVGRPVTLSTDPVAVLLDMARQIAEY